ncbi:MAG: YkgJ family cysteine cluster protein [Magnetococcales bacterium]|nr:YkgJ family cysteine cluster protein [Magnetococcales bacterium]NGZ25296.1 YkgJ family cysteine cluster protein [Magnetococcales bacterium]
MDNSQNSSHTPAPPVRDIDMALPEVPREVRNVLHPVRLGGTDTFKFRCHPGVSCFNECCSKIEIILTPYDMLRLRRRLNLDAEAFLYEYADPSLNQKGQLPMAMLRMDASTGKCPFNTPEGCSVYEDRPVTCRYYPIGLALMHKQQSEGDESFYFLIKEDFCKGHLEDKQWSVAQWRQDQGSDGYDQHNQEWMDVVLRRRTAGDTTGTSLPLSEMFYMATTNPEAFRRFVFDSSFLRRYEVDEETAKLIQEDDEALIAFAFRWLKGALFGSRDGLSVRREAMEDLKQRQKNRPLPASEESQP